MSPVADATTAWDRRVREFMSRVYAQSPNYQAYVLRLWERFLTLGLVGEHFVSELTSCNRSRLLQRVWEMQLASHLDAVGHHLSTVNHGPDLRFEHEGQTIWVEAVCPEASGLPVDWMTPPAPNEFKVGTVPHDAILLRWTSAFAEKARKLAGYLAAGIVGETDAYVIAISGVQLGVIPNAHGVSQLPLAIEVAFPVGPIAVRIDAESGRIQGSARTERFLIRKPNGSPVPTTPFVDPAYVGISALIGFALDRYDEASLPLHVVHNPLAREVIKPRVLGQACDEWRAAPIGMTGEEFELTRTAPPL
jgi:type I restriction enzyme S subunit